jgi:hypothetical protein
MQIAELRTAKDPSHLRVACHTLNCARVDCCPTTTVNAPTPRDEAVGTPQATLANSNEAVFGQLVAFARERHQESRPTPAAGSDGEAGSHEILGYSAD